jgi:hypothetical protein
MPAFKAKLQMRTRKRLLKRKIRPRDWFLDSYFREYAEEVNSNASKLKWHISSGYCRKSDAEKKALLRDFIDSDGWFLAANNPAARVHFYRHWAYHGHQFAHGQENYLVTFTPERYVKPLLAAKSFNIKKLQAWVRNLLRGFDYIAIVEPAYYSNINLGLHPPPIIAFHVHIIVRNPNTFRLRQIMDEVNRSHRSLVPGCPAADMRPIAPGDHHKVLKYVVKEPSGNYRAYPMRKEVMDRQTGEIESWMTGRFRQKSKPASPGVQLRTREVIKDWYMDKIILAGGAGCETLKAIRRELMRFMPRRIQRGRQKQFSGYFEKGDDEQYDN